MELQNITDDQLRFLIGKKQREMAKLLAQHDELVEESRRRAAKARIGSGAPIEKSSTTNKEE